MLAQQWAGLKFHRSLHLKLPVYTEIIFLCLEGFIDLIVGQRLVLLELRRADLSATQSFA
jgi:hypothetical protein